MATDDSALYTGVDGIFGNEAVEESVQEKINEQEQLLNELTPQLQEILDMIDGEKENALKFIAEQADNGWTKEDTEYQVLAAGRYRKYLDGLKTQFQLKLNKAKK